MVIKPGICVISLENMNANKPPIVSKVWTSSHVTSSVGQPLFNVQQATLACFEKRSQINVDESVLPTLISAPTFE